MTSDSSENSPLVLTPDSTGTTGVLSSPDSSTTSSVAAARKTRRQTAFYPHTNSSNKPQKPFSRSAAKRESVMALGSIEHLQYFFTKTGLAAKKKPFDKAHLGLVPAIGGRGHVPSTPSITSISDFHPPPPLIPDPPKPSFSSQIKNYEVDPESILPGVIRDLVAVSTAWKLDKDNQEERTPVNLDIPFDILEVLKTTTRAIRSTRNYLLSLPDEFTADHSQPQSRPRMLGPRTRDVSRTATPSSSFTPQRKRSAHDRITRIRRSALEVLTVLRQLEEFYRLPLDDEAYDALGDAAHSRIINDTSPTPLNDRLYSPVATEDDRSTNRSDYDSEIPISFSIIQVQGQYKSIPVWEDDDEDSSPEREEPRDGWEERLVLGMTWLYKQDIKLSDLQTERAIVGSYLDTVDQVLFHGESSFGGSAAAATTTTNERGWERVQKQREWKASMRGPRNRRVSTAGGEGKTFLDVPLAEGKRRVSTGMVDFMGKLKLSEEPEEMMYICEDETGDEQEEVVGDDDLPVWAKRSTFVDDPLGRAHSLLSHLLTPSLKQTLGRPDFRTEFLDSLASGQVLCVAYNTCVRKSKTPWGFVNKDGIHDILALERSAATTAPAGGGEDEEGVRRKVWTFRRIDNLRLWVGALKLRYMLPIQMPSQHLSTALKTSTTQSNSTPSSPSAMVQTFSQLLPNSNNSNANINSSSTSTREPLIAFDAKVVAKKEDGWEDMLESVLVAWVEKVVKERRVHH